MLQWIVMKNDLLHAPIITRQSPMILLLKVIFCVCIFNTIYLGFVLFLPLPEIIQLTTLNEEVAVFLIIFLIEMITFCVLIIFWYSRFVVVDDHFLLYKKGLILTKEARYKLDTINHMGIEQGLIGKIFRHGDVRISHSSNEEVMLRSIPYPEQLIFLIEAKVQALQTQEVTKSPELD